MKNYTKYLALLCLGLTVGCGEAVEQTDAPPAASSPAFDTATLALTTDVLADTDIGGVRFTATEVDCTTGAPITPANVETADVDLADMFIPGGNGTFENAPYDEDSQHLFADQYFDLSPGCYDVLVEPLQADGSLSEDCWSAHRDAVPVFAGSTTEILLIMQCRGEERGGLDTIASVNHPPQIDDLQFEDSKFTCTERTRVCVTVSDPDSDPVDVTWDIEPGAHIVSSSIETNAAGETVACATIYSQEPGSYQVAATVYDLGYDANGNLVPIEDLLVAQGDPHPSHAALKFPIHMLSGEDCLCECPEGFEFNPVDETCERTETVSVTHNGEAFRVCAGDTNSTYSGGGAKYPSGNTLQNAFFGQSWSDSTDGRLNNVGVWACDGDSNSSGSTPTEEWLGFTTCVDAPTAGDYLIGIAGDNRVRAAIDGVTVSPGSLSTTYINANFNYWWMIPVTLTAGAHTFLLEGYNDGGDAAFGAEIYGPFPAGSLVDDASMMAADVENNIIFSTGDMIGSTFLGADSGMSCPDGYTMDACGAKLECVRTEIKECVNTGGGPIEEDDGTITPL
ncbi:hypothetical protein [Bradymonas sediminis]|uniref:Uncharacterized protein n=1 Tax=Bradymonas sediminis TaxID=1548548 RepID=A0A2Z4FL87_9DELT|nr:hypothetical protein [Bradymonas sediminis]AWV89771.1 hypothetical protein DN745_10650 [Bradymonas sediminis]TDP76484.1 hypothetical protein DFR33_102113 [Bradymonas sediminis]